MTAGSSSRSLHLERLRVLRLPWDRDPWEMADLSPTVNLLCGPNASGKTTTARLLQQLLWPGTVDHLDEAEAQARVRLGERRLRILWDHGQRRVLDEEGVAAELPPLPPADIHRCYLLTLPELLADEDVDLARRLLTLATGGYDVAAAARSLDFGGSPEGVRKVPERLRAARKALRDLQEEQRSLRAEEARRDELEARRDRAERAVRRQAELGEALSILERRQQQEEQKARLARFPEALQTFAGGERQRLERLEEERSECEASLERQRRELEGLRRDRAELGLGEAGLGSGVAGELQDRLDKARAAEQDWEAAEAQQAQVRSVLEEDLRAAGWTGSPEAARRIDPEGLGELDRLVAEAEELRSRRKLHEHLAPLLPDGEAGEEEDGDTAPPGSQALLDGLARLTRWRAAGRVSWWGLSAALAGAGLLLGFGAWFLAGARTEAGWVCLGGGVLALVAALAEGARWMKRRHLRQDLTASGLEELEDPAPARAEGLTRTLQEKFRTRVELEVRRELRRAMPLDPEDLRRREEKLEERRSALVRALGAGPESGVLELTRLAAAIERLRSSGRRLAQAEARAREARTQRDQRYQKLIRRVQELEGDERVEGAENDGANSDGIDLDGLAARVQDLRDRQARWERLTDQIREKERGVREDLEPRLARLDKDLRRFLEDRKLDGLEPGERARLFDLFPDYEETRRALDRATLDVEGRRNEYAGPPSDLDRGAEELERELEEVRQQAAEHQELHDRLIRLDENVDQARRGHRLADAAAELEERREELREVRDRQAELAVGDLLARRLQTDLQMDDVHPLLERARELFARFTHARYELRFGSRDGEPTLQAHQTERSQLLELSELSSATRSQLLLAVRLAFVEHQERDLRLPLVLDEILANADEERAGAVMEAVAEIARDGRQVLVLTAQTDERARWEAVLARTGLDGRSIDLGRIRGRGRLERRPVAEPGGPPPLPSPRGKSHAEYGRLLEVEGIDPWDEEAGTVHLWHLTEDLDLLHRLVLHRLERWGQVRSLLEQKALQPQLEMTPDQVEGLRAAARAVREACRLWRTGRGKKVHRGVLESSGAVSDKFLEPVAELTRELRGDGKALLEALEEGQVSGFWGSKREELESHLRREGFYDDRQPLEPEEARQRLRENLADLLAQGRLSLESLDRLLGQVFAETPGEVRKLGVRHQT